MEHDIFITPKSSQHLDNFDNVCELLCQGGPTLHSEPNLGVGEINCIHNFGYIRRRKVA